MIGTQPIFYLVPVTQELSEAVATAQYPRSPTLVKKYVVAFNSHRLSEGMETLGFRQVALQHYTAFRTLAETRWSGNIMLTQAHGAGAFVLIWNSSVENGLGCKAKPRYMGPMVVLCRTQNDSYCTASPTRSSPMAPRQTSALQPSA
jgi:hypothetical protein